MARLKLTLANIAKRCLPPGPEEQFSSGKPRMQALYWDDDVPGFGLAVGKTTKTFVLQRALRDGRIRRIVIGRLGSWTPEAARKRARELSVDIDRGIDPVIERRRQEDRGVTLGAAMEAHLDLLRARGGSEATAQDIRARFERCLSGWLGRPLAELTKLECRQRHRLLTSESGPYLANGVFRYLRAVYNSALKAHEIPGVNPTVGVGWNKMRRRQEPIPWAELPAWRARIEELSSIGRDFQLFVLFTGLRSTDAATVRWEHIDFGARTIHRPRPKGGEDRAFTVPLSKPALEILARRKAENPIALAGPDEGWAFPSRTRAGAVQPLVWRRAARRRADDRGGPGRSPHRLRDTFATAAREAGVGWYEKKVLMNHALPQDDVTTGYVAVSIEHLRGCVEKVGEFLKGKMG